MSIKKGVSSMWLVLLCHLMKAFAQQGCDKVFSSYQSGNRMGEFQSPGYPSHYPNGVSCKYKFIGRKGKERVKIQFTDFDLQGRRPQCINDFVNIYSQLNTESDDLLGAQLSGPFCGKGTDYLPALVLSTKHILVIWFYSNNEKSNNGFKGTYEFVEVSSVSVDHDMATVSPHQCVYTVKSSERTHGNLKSPTYPGVYPDNMFCAYSLQGGPGQRIKLIFQDFSLFYGDEYCPFDYLTIYDGNTKYDPEIGKFCGSYNRSTVIYSSTGSLRMEFITGENRVYFGDRGANADFKFERRGFNISYEFSERFVKLDHHFIKSGSQHIRGTECDIRIMSGKETNGTFVSPSYPDDFPEGIICRYYLDGLMDEQHLEQVKVQFFDFNIPGNLPYCWLGYLGENINGRLDADSVKPKYCEKVNPPIFTSNGPRMVITLNTTGAVRGGKFVANYRFITDYGIRGEQIREGECKFHYSSVKTKAGIVNSPRHPGIYTMNTDCEYIFRPLKDEFVLISFTVFKLSGNDDISPPCSSGDYVAFYEGLGTKNRRNFTLTEKFCGQRFPGPYITSRLLKMVFHSDSMNGYVGFKANYEFFQRSFFEKYQACNARIDARGTGGVITSPRYPANYPSLVRCEWVITASMLENRILVEVADINMEGEYGQDGYRSSCSNVAVRLFNDSMIMTPVELICGKNKDTDVTKSYISIHDSFKITFVTSNASHGGTGFKISWTEIHTGASTMDCTGFQCSKNKYCIAPSLKCNKEPNCGLGDNSDESAECSATALTHFSDSTSRLTYVLYILVASIFSRLLHTNLQCQL